MRLLLDYGGEVLKLTFEVHVESRSGPMVQVSKPSESNRTRDLLCSSFLDHYLSPFTFSVSLLLVVSSQL